MTADPILTLAWLILAHLVADFLLQTSGVVAAKTAGGGRALRGFANHALGVAICLVPVALAFGGPGVMVLVAIVVSHVVIDRIKIVATSRTEAAAMAESRRQHEGAAPAAGLGRAWTPLPAAWFVFDQVAHLAIIWLAWAIWLAGTAPTVGWAAAVTTIVGGSDPKVVHEAVRAFVVVTALLIANVRGGAILVAILVRPLEVGDELIGHGADGTTDAAAGLPNLAALLRALGGVEGLRWIRLHYAYPTACTNELLDVMAGEARVAKYLDVPIQHIDSGVLKAMRRGYGEKQVRDLCERVRARVPGVTLRTTFIVGHPGETEESFQRLCDFVREAELDRVGVFNFSREEGTVAALLPKRVPPKEVDARRRELLRIQRDISKKKLRALRGSLLEVLVEGPSDESEYLLMGRHEGQAPEIDGQVYLSFAEDGGERAAPPAGTLLRARVTHSAEYDLAAEIAA